MKTAMVVLGTRPEAIKMAPVVVALRRMGMHVRVVATAQHRNMLDQVLELFGIEPDCDLDLMRADQSLAQLFADILVGMRAPMDKFSPDIVLVHGDTSTTLASAMAAFYARVPIAHVEAGLRTGRLSSPFPEEMNRRLVAPMANLHFAPTGAAKLNLVSEGIEPSTIEVTGNTVVDALRMMDSRLSGDPTLRGRAELALPEGLNPSRKLILVTGHRRENHGAGLDGVCRALKVLAERGDVQIVYPVHPNPNVSRQVVEQLSGAEDVFLTPPLDYASFITLLKRSHLAITDSGGIQEEAPAFGKPVFVTRDTSERPEAIEAGTALLVGTDCNDIVSAVSAVLDDDAAFSKMARAHNPFGDGAAAGRIAERTFRYLHELL